MPATKTTPGAANREVWESGDYSVIGSRLVSMSEDLCETADIRGGQRVLDVATGNGNAALAAARRGAQATGVDIAPSLIDAARHRAGADGTLVLPLRYVVALIDNPGEPRAAS